MRKKRHVKRGFVKMHKLIDVNAGMILAVALTSDSVGDSKMFKTLLEKGIGACRKKTSDGQEQEVEGTAEVDRKTFAILGDSGYGSREITKTCKDLGVESRIKLNINSGARDKGSGGAWGISVRETDCRITFWPGQYFVQRGEVGELEDLEGKSRVWAAMAGGDLVFCIQKAVWRGCTCHKGGGLLHLRVMADMNDLLQIPGSPENVV